MSDISHKTLVSDWGDSIHDAVKSSDRFCDSGCTESKAGALAGIYGKMAKLVVGFTKQAPYSSSSRGALAVVCKCPKCSGIYWYHIPESALETFVAHCPSWPAEQKDKFKAA